MHDTRHSFGCFDFASFHNLHESLPLPRTLWQAVRHAAFYVYNERVSQPGWCSSEYCFLFPICKFTGRFAKGKPLSLTSQRTACGCCVGIRNTGNPASDSQTGGQPGPGHLPLGGNRVSICWQPRFSTSDSTRNSATLYMGFMCMGTRSHTARQQWQVTLTCLQQTHRSTVEHQCAFGFWWCTTIVTTHCHHRHHHHHHHHDHDHVTTCFVMVRSPLNFRVMLCSGQLAWCSLSASNHRRHGAQQGRSRRVPPCNVPGTWQNHQGGHGQAIFLFA